MKRLIFVVTALVALTFAVPAFAGSSQNHTCQGGHNCNTTTNNQYGGQGGQGGTGVGIGLGIGVGKGGSANSNATAFGGNATAFGGKGGNASAGVVGSGNSNVDVTSVLKNTNLNSNHNLNSNRNNASVGDITNTLGQEQGQMQGQEMGQGQALVDNSELSFEVDGDSIVYEAPRFPVNTAAPVFAGNCAQGVSAQTMQFGGSFASGNPVCDFIAVAGAYIAGGDPKEAFRVLGKAEKAADWRFFFARVRMIITIGLL